MVWMTWLAVAWAGESGGFDHTYGDFAAVLSGAVTARGVDYDAIAKRRAILDAFLRRVATADVSGFTREEQLALYVNAYNGYTLQLVLDHLPLTSIRDLDGGNPWKARTFPVGGAPLTLDQMEHAHARKLADGRVHAVVNCASKGCPPLPATPLTPEGLDARLDAEARRWVATNAYVLQGDTLALSKIFDWYGEDFVRWRAVDHPQADDKQDAALGFLQAFGPGTLPEVARVTYAPYDWTLNRAP